MFFLFYKFLFFISDFLEIQRKSFYKFLHFQLGDELAKISPFCFASKKESFQLSTTTNSTFSSNFDRIQVPDFSYRSLMKMKKMLPKKSFLKLGRLHHRQMSTPMNISFLSKHFRYSQPFLNIEESILLSKTYCCHFYVPIQFNSLIQWIFLGTLPLLTRRGHFIINGTPRVVINQIIRNPGIYFHRDARFFYAEIIGERGPWVRMEIDKKKKIWVSLTSQQSGWTRMEFSFFFQNFYPKYIDLLDLGDLTKPKKSRKTRKNPILTISESHFLPLPNLTIKRLQASLPKGVPSARCRRYPLRLVRNFGIFMKCRMQIFYKNFRILKVHFFKRPRQFFKELSALEMGLFASSSKSADLNFNLGQNGRSRLNQRLGLSLQTLSLTPTDFLAISDFLLKIYSDQENIVFDDIDNLKNRKFITIGDLLQNQLAIGLQRLQKIFDNTSLKKSQRFYSKKEKLSIPNKVSPDQKALSLFIVSIVNNQPINSSFKEFFHSHQLSQYLDQSNPLAEITHKRRLSCLGSGGVNRDTAGMAIRGIHPSHYGRICPIETPEGKNAGLVNSLTNSAKKHVHGWIQTPFRSVYKQHEQDQQKLVFFSVENQENQNIFFHQTLPKFKNISVSSLKILNLRKCQCNSINFIALNPQQFLSVATTCIPFIEHDDANRALMGSNMQRQSLPLIFCEQPFVTTLNAWRVLSDLKETPMSSMSGLVVYISVRLVLGERLYYFI